MTSHPERAKEIFLELIGTVPSTDWDRRLDDACAGDSELRNRVSALLRAHVEPGSFLEQPAVAVGNLSPTLDQPAMTLPGARVGPYQLLKLLGQGGMGAVYLAEQREPVKRRVALKIIKPGMDTRQVIARFEAERQALAMMDHPNIARVFDAGMTAGGHPYFVMELVDGVSITQYCDRQRLTPRERLELFLPVCQAVQHAHQKGVIHRDLKPSNILVTLYDGRPVPKVIDFGVAKAISQASLEKATFTQDGQIVGTPEYMSPEQAQSHALIDTRSDVYSLGVVLYELLTGDTPLDRQRLRSSAWDEIMRVIREEEPPKPSTKLSSSDALPSVAACRSIEPARLGALVRGELDWIVMKALDKDRGRRYESPSALARDIENHLHDQPVLAGPPSASYRFRKFARRNRTPVLAGGVVVLALLVGAGLATGQAIRATRAERRAEEQLQIAQQQERHATRQAELAQRQKQLAEEAVQREAELRGQAEAARDEAELVTEFLVEVFRSPDPARAGRTLTVAEMLDKARVRVTTELADNRLLQARLWTAIGSTYFGLGLLQEAHELAEQSYEIFHEVLGADAPRTMSAMHDLACTYWALRRLDQSIPLFEEALSLYRQVLGENHPETLSVKASLGINYTDAGRSDEAVALLEDTLRMCRETLEPEHRITLGCMNNLAGAYEYGGDLKQALPLREEIFRLSKNKWGPEHYETLSSMNNLATTYGKVGRPSEKLSLLEEAIGLLKDGLGPEHPRTLTSMMSLGVAYQELGQHDKALELHEETLTLFRKTLGPEHPTTLAALHSLAHAHLKKGQYREGLALHEEVFALQQKILGPDRWETLQSLRCLGTAYLVSGSPLKAIPLLEEARDRIRDTLGAEHPESLRTMGELATAYDAADQFDKAISLQEHVLELRKAKLGPEHPETHTTMGNLGNAYLDVGRFEEAIALHERVLELSKAKLGPDHPGTHTSMNNLAAAYSMAGRSEEAIALHKSELELSKATLGPDHPATLGSMNNLAAAYTKAGRSEEAIVLHEQTLALLQAQLGADHPQTAGSMASLALSYLDAGRHAEAEKYARECLRIRQQTMPDDWRTYNTMALLGRSLAGQKAFADAEPLLLEGYEGMIARAASIPAAGKIRITEALEAIIELYEDWEKPEEAERWREAHHRLYAGGSHD